MSESADTPPIKLSYESLAARYASQVILGTTDTEIMLEFSSGVMADPDSGEPRLPIHTRIAMPEEGARRLHQLLSQVLERR